MSLKSSKITLPRVRKPDEECIAVVIPCYRVKQSILSVIAAIGDEISLIFVVDDACPDASGQYVIKHCTDPRVKVIFHKKNQGVGGAVMTGYHAALTEFADVIVKIDGDGQMDPALITNFIEPILAGQADYTKGNRFYYLEEIKSMPKVRLFGNAVLSFMTKLSSGYWNLFDPTNGYTAIHAKVASHLPIDKISRRYYFESDMLFRLNTLRAVVLDVPMGARYQDEVSNLKISKVIGEFLFKNVRNFFKRIFYNYYLRDLSLASIELPLGIFLLLFGLIYGAYHWFAGIERGIPTPAGTVMLAALPVLMGVQFVLAFLAFDISNVPRNAINSRIDVKN